MERNYVIVCNEHKPLLPETLLFWGFHTEDSEERNFGGYTIQIDKCERYTREELESWRGYLKKEYPFYDEIKPHSFRKHSEVLISIEQLEKMGYREMHVMCQ
ncbi:hypothetical protein EQM14_01540 [Caproiciproducens sp. NJN-50]|uniref:hypothetical protein n=1 Tax=Caproiciproducens sp. NJN-50 TaxID=2507162 RepID=UPI000FFE0D83|nr:hypothetical protein [Caproiciproducens sp. NJN-50]QAT48567.1 hypothetical protein EQM14_01540 [Caproiciproducens sp. NJN-50]